MSLWTSIRDTWENVSSLGLYNPEKSRQADRDQRNLVNSQIKAYQDQTAIAKSSLDEARAATDAVKRQVNEKQIRTLRRTNRAQGAGLLGVGAASSPDMNTQLGG